jgi:hypothetical protein
VSTASEIAAAIARIAPQNALTGGLQQKVEAGLGGLDQLFSGLTQNGGLNSLPNLLIPGGSSTDTMANDIADRIIACLPLSGATLGNVLGTDTTARAAISQLQALWSDPSGSTKAPQSPVTDANLSKGLIKAFKDAGGDGPAAMGLHDSFSQMMADSTGTLVVASVGWNSDKVRQLLQQQLGKWINKIKTWGGTAKRTTAAAAAIEFELKYRYSVREAVATALSLGGHLLIGTNDLDNDLQELAQGTPSSATLGADIHKRFQEDYRNARIPLNHIIEQDDLVYGLSLGLAARGRRLGDLAFESPHVEFAAMYLARQSIKPIDLSLQQVPAVQKMLKWSIRDDNTNFSDGCIFEIKPVRSAWLGVAQEMYYRSSYNMWMAIFQDFPTLPMAAAKIFGQALTPGAIMCEWLHGGTAAEWPEANNARGGVKPFVKGGQTFTVMTTCVDALPGLLLYWIFDLPVWVLKLLYDFLQSKANDLVNKVQRVVIEVYTWIVAVLIAIPAVLMLLAALPEIEIGALLAALGRIGVMLRGPVLAGITAFQAVLQQFSKQWNIVSSVDANSGLVRISMTPTGGSIPDGVLTTGIQVGFLRIENIPVDAARYLGTVIQAGFDLTQVLLNTANA